MEFELVSKLTKPILKPQKGRVNHLRNTKEEERAFWWTLHWKYIQPHGIKHAAPNCVQATARDVS